MGKRNKTLNFLKKSACSDLNRHLFVDEKAEKGRNKHGNIVVEYDGKIFQSIKEKNRYITLQWMLSTGKIKNLEWHVIFRLEAEDHKICDYESDFCYHIVKTGEFVVEDVKSSHTRTLAVYRLKKKLMLATLGIAIKEV